MAGDPPLKGVRVLELAGLAPAPFCGLLLASYGASVLRIDRPHPLAHPTPPNPNSSPPTLPPPPPTPDLLTTHKSSICLNLKTPSSHALLLSLLPHTDILIDPFRPHVLESLNLNPSTLLQAHNPKLIIIRLTGFRRTGAYAAMAGHDINYLSVSGILSLLGPSPHLPPLPPGNLLADFAAGGLVAFCGALLALLHRSTTGQGQVVSANMVDGVSCLGLFARLAVKTAVWDGGRGMNLLDGGAPFYRCYETRDAGRYVAVGALEERFFAALLRGLGLEERDVLGEGSDRNDKRNWEGMRRVLERRFREKTRREWEEVFDGTDACVTPVLELGEMERSGYEQRGLVGLSESPGRSVAREEQWVGKGLRPGEGGEEVLREWVGWKRGREYGVEDGALVKLENKMERSKL